MKKKQSNIQHAWFAVGICFSRQKKNITRKDQEEKQG